MAHKKNLSALNTTLKDLRNKDRLFGAAVVILSGDFRQTLPIIQRSTALDELYACFKFSPLWCHVKILKLRINMRVNISGDPDAEEFSNQLSIGDGLIETDAHLNITLPSNFCNLVSDREQLIDRVFHNLNINIRDTKWISERAILAPLNEDVDELNFIIQEKLIDNQTRTYLSYDSVAPEEEAVNFPIEFLNSLSVLGVPPHKLVLKIGSPIIVLRNIDPPKLCNGTRLVVKALNNNIIVAKILGGSYSGQEVFIPRISFKPDDLLFNFRRKQFPVKLAYAMTINKSQGQSIKVVGIDLTKSCFAHGQLYVACSRVSQPRNMFVLARDGKTKNIVMPRALQ